MTMTERLQAAEDALREILKLGRVCEDFEVCEHSACNDSCAAHLIALDYFNVERIMERSDDQSRD